MSEVGRENRSVSLENRCSTSCLWCAGRLGFDNHIVLADLSTSCLAVGYVLTGCQVMTGVFPARYGRVVVDVIAADLVVNIIDGDGHWIVVVAVDQGVAVFEADG